MTSHALASLMSVTLCLGWRVGLHEALPLLPPGRHQLSWAVRGRIIARAGAVATRPPYEPAPDAAFLRGEVQDTPLAYRRVSVTDRCSDWLWGQCDAEARSLKKGPAPTLLASPLGRGPRQEGTDRSAALPEQSLSPMGSWRAARAG